MQLSSCLCLPFLLGKQVMGAPRSQSFAAVQGVGRMKVLQSFVMQPCTKEVLCMLADSENLILCMSKIILTRFWHSPSSSRFRLISEALKCSAQRPAGGARPLPRQSFVHAVTCYFLHLSANMQGPSILQRQGRADSSLTVLYWADGKLWPEGGLRDCHGRWQTCREIYLTYAKVLKHLQLLQLLQATQPLLSQEAGNHLGKPVSEISHFLP